MTFGRAPVRKYEIDEASFGDGGALPSAKLGFSQTGGAGSSNAATYPDHRAEPFVQGALGEIARRKPASNANRHAALCLATGTLLIGFAGGSMLGDYISGGAFGWLIIAGMSVLILANFVMMED